jgi:hypothetical protein
MGFPSLSAPPAARNAVASVVGLLFLLLVAPVLLTIFVALLLRGASTFTVRHRFYDGRQIDLVEFWCPPDSFGDFLWQTRLNQVPIVFTLVSGDVALDPRLLTLLSEDQ